MASAKEKFLARYLRWTALSFLSGVLAGTAAAVFLHLLNGATAARTLHPSIIWALPAAGFFIGWVYFRYGSGVSAGSNLVLDEIHNPKNVIPFRMTPFILLGTVLTHLFGGSAGREGTVVQMGAALSDQLSRFFRVEKEERKILLVAGAGAGFGAAIGAPWAGIFFGMEVISVGRLRVFALFECFVASMVAYGTVHVLQVQHTHFPEVTSVIFSFSALGWAAVSGIIFGLASRPFVWFSHGVERIQDRFVKYPPLRPFIAGLVLCAFYYLEGSDRYAGLGLPVIQQSFEKVASFLDPLLKLVATGITVGSGFKGGEFIPLVFIGSTLGSAMSTLIPLSLPLMAALGFASVFGAAANTPLACSLMAAELFGWRIFPYAVIACFTAYFFSSHRGIYKAQKITHKKVQRILGTKIN